LLQEGVFRHVDRKLGEQVFNELKSEVLEELMDLSATEHDSAGDVDPNCVPPGASCGCGFCCC